MTGPHDMQVTGSQQAAGIGDPRTTEELFPILYEELRRLARRQMEGEQPGQTLQPTALVHEAYLRLVRDRSLQWDNRGHFFAAAARAMRQILVERARRRRAVKHGGLRVRVSIEEIDVGAGEQSPEVVLGVHEALARLEAIDPRQARIVLLRYFAGLTIEETARALDISTTTVTDEWRFAAAWLCREMSRGDEPRP